VLTIDLNNYISVVSSPADETLATVTVTDVTGGVTVKIALDPPATFFAVTGGAHVTVGLNLDTSVTAADITDTTPSSRGFKAPSYQLAMFPAAPPPAAISAFSPSVLWVTGPGQAITLLARSTS
jgi:hypothetical protein